MLQFLPIKPERPWWCVLCDKGTLHGLIVDRGCLKKTFSFERSLYLKNFDYNNNPWRFFSWLKRTKSCDISGVLQCFYRGQAQEYTVRLQKDVVTSYVSHDHDYSRINGSDYDGERGQTPCIKDGFGELQQNKNIRYSFICPNKSHIPPLYIIRDVCSANIPEPYNPQAVILVSLVLKFQHLRHQWNLAVVSCLCPNQKEIQSDSLSANNCQLLPTQQLVQEMMTLYLQEVIRETATDRRRGKLSFQHVFSF